VRLRLLLIALVGLLVLAPGAGAVTGKQRVLVVLATWGPQPFTQASVQQTVFGGTNDFIGHSSFGQLTLDGDVTTWIRAFDGPPADCEQTVVIASQARDAAQRSGQSFAGYDRVITVIPAIPCRFRGVSFNEQVLIVGAPFPGLVAHELGHTYGLGHANRWSCAGGHCQSIEYGDQFDVMGGRAAGQYNAYEKYSLGWLKNVTRVAENGTYTIDQLELPSALPQAVVVATAKSEYWFDHREPVLEDAGLAGSPVATGVFVHAGPNLFRTGSVSGSAFPSTNILLPNQQHSEFDALLPGDTFSEDGAFKLTVLSHTDTHVDVQFAWTDTTPPKPPGVLEPRGTIRTTGTRRLPVSWNPAAEDGSGVARYGVTLDGAPPRIVDADFRIGDHVELTKPRPGRHAVRIVAVDRAGNRGAAAVSRFTIPVRR